MGGAAEEDGGKIGWGVCVCTGVEEGAGRVDGV